MLDLHCHSTASDGSETPEALVALARQSGLTALALTDHDTVSGLDRFVAAGGSELAAVPGVEVSCQWHNQRTLHIVGLFIDWRAPAMVQSLRLRREERDRRNAAILARLRQEGLDIDAEAVGALAGGESVGRPHIARVMVERGFCRDVGEAFSQWLVQGRPAFVRRNLPFPGEFIGAIHQAGGVAVWAHPYQRLGDPDRLTRRLGSRLAGLELDAIEVRWNDAGMPEPAWRELAQANRLGLSGGSDFHGLAKPGSRLCGNRGVPALPAAVLDDLLTRVAVIRRRRQLPAFTFD